MTHKTLIAFGFLALLPACATAASGQPAAAPAEVELRGADGAPAGAVSLTGAPGGVLIRVRATGLPPGWHGTHLHAVGRCQDAIQSAGGHINHAPEARPHGLLNPAGPDLGDLPNLHVAADGDGAAEMFTALVTLDGLRDADGSALVIHAGPDDHVTQPIGGAGARIACAVLSPPRD